MNGLIEPQSATLYLASEGKGGEGFCNGANFVERVSFRREFWG